MKEIYRYRAFGLRIASAIELPELQPDTGKPDVTIRVGKTPREIEGALESHKHYQATKDHFLMHIKDVGNYYIAGGNCIILEPLPNADMKAVRLFLLGSAMGALLFQRGILPIHGSAVVCYEYCFIITGAQGAGKSTLAAALKQKGYSILTDDVAAVATAADGIAWVYPSYPGQKLWRDSLESLGGDVSSHKSVVGRIDKYAVPIRDEFCETPKKLAAIYELRRENCQEVSIDKLSGMDKLSVIMNNIYRFGFVSGLGLQEEIFKRSAGLAGQVSVSRIIRPDGTFSVEDQVALVERDLKEWA